MIISLNFIKYIKLCIISPAYDIIINLLMILFFFLIAFLLQSQGIQLTNYQLTELISDTFKESQFRSIKTKNEYYSYVEFLVNKLYEYDPVNNDYSIPYYLPYGAIRLKKFSNSQCNNKFNELINGNRSPCPNNDECTLQLLSEFYSDSNCGKVFAGEKGDKSDSPFIGIARKFEGKYTNYDLEKEGINLDFTIDEYYSPNGNNTQDFIRQFVGEDKDIKFIALLFNVYFPYDDSYAIIIAGIEMINSHVDFNEPYFIFNSSILNKVENKNKGFIALLILYMITAILNFIKVIYEMNVKFIFPTHFIEFLDACGNFVLLVFIYLYLLALEVIPIIEEKDNVFINDNIYNKDFHDFYTILSLRGYVILILSIIFLSMPIRIMSLLSWSTFLSQYLIQYITILFRMIPGLVVNSIIFIASLIPTIFLNYFFYRAKIVNFQNIFSSILFFTDIFQDVVTIKEEEKENNGYSIKYSITDSEYTLIFGVIQKIIFIYSYISFISSCVNSFEKAVQIESKKEDDEIIKKMEEIEGLLEKEEENNTDNLRYLKRQILWINYENKNDLYNEILKKSKNILLCKNSNQVISFLKYLFALKPMMQFKNLKNKLCIVIQYSSTNNLIDNMSLKESRNNNITTLLEWLNFVGCKIPVTIYCINNISFLQKIKASSPYKFISFTDNLKSIEKFVEEEDNMDNYFNDNNEELKIVKVNEFTLYKVSYIIVNKRTKTNTKSKKEKENSDDEDEKISLLSNKNKKEPGKLDLKVEDNEFGIEEDKKENRKDNSSLISKSSSSSESSSSNSDKE